MKLRLFAMYFAFVSIAAPCYANTESYTPVEVKFPPRQVLVRNLNVSVYSHKLPNSSQQPAWSFVTNGFAKLNRPELVMTVVKQDDESNPKFPSDHLMFFQQFSEFVNQGNVVSVGGCMRFEVGADGSKSNQFKGAIYLPVEEFEGVDLPKSALAIMPVTAEELDAYDIGGAARVVGKLSRQSQFYPFPTWCDRNRQSVFTKGEIQVMKMEPVSKTPTTSLFGAGIIKDKDKLSMSIPSAVREDLVQKLKDLPPDSSFRINLSIDPRANAYYVWGVQQATMAAAEGGDASILAGTFILIMPGSEKSQFAPYKDGFMLMLSNDDLNKFKESIYNGTDCTLDSTAGGALKSFEVKFSNKTFNIEADLRTKDSN